MTASATVADLCRQLDMITDQYRDELRAKAETDVDYRRERAKRILRARADGEAASATAAETVADADDVIADLRLKYLIADGIAASTKSKIESLRERIGYGRSLMATQREADRLHATGETP